MTDIPSDFRNEIDRVFKLQLSLKHKLKRSGTHNRIEKLQRIYNWTTKHKNEIEEAVYSDFKKPPLETDLSEIFTITSEIKHVKRKLKKWMKPKRVSPTFAMLTTRSKIKYEPKGVTLIISPWNYPFMLAVEPLISSLAAGNSIILKPSEISHNTSALIQKMINELFDESEVKVFQGDKEVSSYLLSKPFDHIFFTGSTKVGRIVMKAAADNLSSVTLELGGKSPVIIDDSADLDDAAGKIAWSKLFNAGQSCQAPDYILIENSIKDKFLFLLKNYLNDFCSQQNGGCQYFPSVINNLHFNRIKELTEDAINSGAKLEFGGNLNPANNRINPAILTGVPLNSRIMKEEIFGPVLPVISYNNLNEAIDVINSNGNPLAIYIFSKNQKAINNLLNSTVSGGVCINDLFIQFSHLNLPFGGIRESGIGSAHGFYGFKAFSNERAILKHHKFSPFKLFYPPYTEKKKKLAEFLIKYL